MSKQAKDGRKTPLASIRASFGGKTTRVGGYSVIATLVVLAIMVAINLFVGAIPSVYTKIDTTPAQLYSLSEQTTQMVSGLETDVTVYWLVQTGQEDSLVSEMLDRYQGLSGHLKVVKRDPVVYPNFAVQYTSQQVSNNSLIVESEGRSKYVSYGDIYLTDYSNYYYDYSYTQEFDGEGVLTSAIDYVTNDELPKIYALTGHGEQSLSLDLQSTVEKQNMLLEEISLLTQEDMPEDVDCLLIYSPTRDISTQEQEMIAEYLEGGGKLLLVTDYTEEALPNLASLMEGYGATLVDGIVVEGDSNLHLRGYPHYLLPNMQAHDITNPLIESGYLVMMPIAQGIQVADELPEGVTLTQLLTTSSTAYSKLAGYEMQTLEKETGDIAGPFAVGVAITKEQAEGETQIVWLTTTALLEESIDQMVGGANEDLFLNALGWMNQRENSITIRAKSLTTESLVVPEGAASGWSALLIGVIPCLLLGIGIFVVVKRRRK